MSVFLIGGGVDSVTALGPLDPFRVEAAARSAGRPPRLAIALFDIDGSAEFFRPSYVEALRAGGPVDVELVRVVRGETVAPEVFAGMDGIVVGGGPTPDYWAGLIGRSTGFLVVDRRRAG